MDPDELVPTSLHEPPIDTAALRERVRARTGVLVRQRRRRNRLGGAGVLAVAAIAAVALAGVSTDKPENVTTGKDPRPTTTLSPSTSTSSPRTTTSTAPPSTTAPTTTAAPGTGSSTTIVTGTTTPAATTAVPLVTTPTTAPPVDHGECGKPKSAALNHGLTFTLSLTSTNGGWGVSGSATIRNDGPGTVKLTLASTEIVVDGVDADGYLTTVQTLNNGGRIVELAQGESTTVPVKLANASCGGNTKPVSWVGHVSGMRADQVFEVTSPPFGAR